MTEGEKTRFFFVVSFQLFFFRNECHGPQSAAPTVEGDLVIPLRQGLILSTRSKKEGSRIIGHTDHPPFPRFSHNKLAKHVAMQLNVTSFVSGGYEGFLKPVCFS